MLKYFITSRAKRKLLKLFLTNPDKEFYLREVEKLVDEPVNAVRRELGHLEKAGFLKSQRRGKLKYFRVDKSFPFYPELKRIIYLTVGLGDYLKGRFKGSEKIELALIYGSVAKDEESERSDIDLLVVGEIKGRDLHKLVSEIEHDIRREIDYVLMTKEEFNQRLKNDDPLIKRILREKKLILKGNLNVG